MKYREEADYNPSCVFSREDYAEFREKALDLSAGVIHYLRNQGYL